MRPISARGLAAGAIPAFLLASCFWIGTHEWYERSDPAERYEGPLPPGNERSGMAALPAGAVVLVLPYRGTPYPATEDEIQLDVRLLLPAGVRAELLAPEVVLASSAWPAPERLPIACIEDWTVAPRRIHATDAELVGTSLTHVYPGLQLSFVAEGPRDRTCLPAVDEFEVRLPALRIDGEIVVPPPLRFRARERFGVWWAVD